jgi:polar amino acid transport system permease protein
MIELHFSIVPHYWPALAIGLWYKLKLNLFAAVSGTILGIFIAFARLSQNKFIAVSAIWYIEVFRALPVLVLLIWFHYVFPAVSGITFDSFSDACIVLSLNLSAVVADIVRSGVQSIPIGQMDAAKAIGMTKLQTIKRITLPIAIRRMTPSLVSQYVNVIKLSALASVIGVPELLHSASDLMNLTYRPLEFYTVIALMFLAIILPLTWLSRKIEMKAHL